MLASIHARPASFDLPEPVGRNLIHGTQDLLAIILAALVIRLAGPVHAPLLQSRRVPPPAAIFDAGHARGHAAAARRRRIRRAGGGAGRRPGDQSEPTEREIIVETSVAQIVLSNRGGRVLHWRLKDYRTPAGELVDLIPSNAPAEPRPLQLRLDDEQLTQRVNTALYQVGGDSGKVDATSASKP